MFVLDCQTMYDTLTGARLIRRGAGGTMLSVRVAVDVAGKIRAEAGRAGLTVSEWMRSALIFSVATGERRRQASVSGETRIGE